MSFLNLAGGDLSSDDEDDVDYVPVEEGSDDEKKEEETEDEKRAEEAKLKKNKAEAKKIWEELKSESVIKKPDSEEKNAPSNEKSKNEKNSMPSKSNITSPQVSQSNSSTAGSSPVIKVTSANLDMVSTNRENKNLLGLTNKPSPKPKGLDIMNILKGGQPSKRKSTGAGLDNILSTINKKSKLTTLEKSKLDWSQFKKDEDIEEELTNFTKSKDSYVERLNFLDRTDQRQFELEKEVRLKRSKR